MTLILHLEILSDHGPHKEIQAKLGWGEKDLSLGSLRRLEFAIKSDRKEKLYIERVSEYSSSLGLNTKLCMYRARLYNKIKCQGKK